MGGIVPFAVSPGQPHYLFSTADFALGPPLLTTGSYDLDELRWCLDYLRHPQVGRTVVEVGANIGTTTVPLLTDFGAAMVEAFEPAPTNVKLLRCNLILNEVDQLVRLHARAVSARAGAVVLELDPHNHGDHRIRTSDSGVPEQLGEGQRDTLTVDAVTLDSALDASLDEVGLVWVDTQGHEADVMDGAERLFEARVPWVVEYWPYGLLRAGAVERLHEHLRRRFSRIVDVRESMRTGRPQELDAKVLPDMARTMGTRFDEYTDLILVP